ncbi:DUF6056 family protein [Apibacter raozihei]|uniref:DUF6056 family protein n=1 Tax=Apibacter raozihei TaxID=2500547 RepID=UPI000FE3A9AB|nr:DUF6056 family protein [Apibacter raozihei]
MNNFFTKHAFSKIIILLFLLSIIPILILCFYTEPALDDYSYALNLTTKSFIETQIQIYLHWSSRYTATAILITNPIHWGYFFGYNIIALIMILSFISAAAYLFYQVTKNIKMTILFTAFFCLSYFMFLPNVYQGLYWLPGSSTYHLANVLFLTFLGMLINYNYTSNRIVKIILFVLIFFIIGCNEISMVFLDISLFTVFIFNYISKRKVSYYYLLLLIWAGILTLFVLLSPGNSVRSALVVNPLTPTEIFLASVRKTLVVVVKYGIVPLLINIIIFYAFRKQLKNLNLRFLKYSILLYIGLFIILLFCGSFPSLWSLGIYSPLRSVNVMFLIILVFNTIFSYKIVTSRLIFKTNISRNVLSMALLFIIFSYSFIIRDKDILFIPNNIYWAYDDLLSGKAFQYKKEMNHRFNMITESKKDTIYVPPIQSKPKLIFEIDLSQNPKYFYNIHMAEFFHKKAIICK